MGPVILRAGTAHRIWIFWSGRDTSVLYVWLILLLKRLFWTLFYPLRWNQTSLGIKFNFWCKNTVMQAKTVTKMCSLVIIFSCSYLILYESKRNISMALDSVLMERYTLWHKRFSDLQGKNCNICSISSSFYLCRHNVLSNVFII
jgi:hypothetical protein